MSAPTRVVCLGGGYASLGVCQAGRQAIRDGKLHVTVVSRENYHEYHGLVPEMLVGKVQPGTIISSARRVFAPARFHCAEIESVDLDKRTVTTSRALDGREYTLPYDHLVIGVGSVDNLSLIPGVAEHALKLKTYADCFKARNQILTMMELADIEEDAEERRRLLTFVVAGGNFAGIEVATELTEYLHALVKKEYPHINPAELRVVVVHAIDTILPELAFRHPELVRRAQRYLDDLGPQGLELRLKTYMTAATTEEAVLSTGERIQTRTIFSCAGTAQSPLLDELPFERDPRGRLLTENTCRLPGTSNVWAGGDCAAVPLPTGDRSPMLFSYALFEGRTIARNILRVTEGQDPQPFTFTGFGDAVAMGNRKAVAHLKGRLSLTGLPAWLMWRGIILYFMPAWDRKIRMVLDWLVSPVFGRDVVSMRVGDNQGVSQALYEPGQVIVKQGDVGRYVYAIQSGEVEVVQSADGKERLLAVLKAGDHFGETAIFERVRRTATVRARTRVQLLVLGREEALNLSQAIEPFGETIRQVPIKPEYAQGYDETKGLSS